MHRTTAIIETQRPHLHRITDPLMGVEREELRERAFWQSRATMAGRRFPAFELTDLPQLARAVRKAAAA